MQTIFQNVKRYIYSSMDRRSYTYHRHGTSYGFPSIIMWNRHSAFACLRNCQNISALNCEDRAGIYGHFFLYYRILEPTHMVYESFYMLSYVFNVCTTINHFSIPVFIIFTHNTRAGVEINKHTQLWIALDFSNYY